ncbi:DUF6929 family protein [Flavobacterium phycosphaerae]|uniref:DUF6929 family protein n=1 Tax=Flavobacterium phycosphaerae TaxID=2697515 RepID=UPI001389B075|nr:hypothetical protein [Flavobacterium phycosphaerae]
MQNIQLLPYFEIKGIAAASGLVYKDDSLFIISDDSTFLYEYRFTDKALNKIKLFEDSQESLAKKDKADFESITLFENTLYIFGSGSTKKRDIRVKYHLDSQEIKAKDVSKLHKKLRQTIALDEDELNIEGVIIDTENYYLFQRGNGAQAQNGIFTVNKVDKTVRFHLILLPKVNSIEATFTDAVEVDDKVYFTAACEDTTSTYTDGEIYGSFLGCMDLKTKEVTFVQQIAAKQKFEGLTLFKQTPTQLEFLLCEDNDTEELESVIYKLTVEL